MILFIGTGEIVFIVLIIILFFGSKKIPEIARNIGKAINYVKNATNDIKHEINDSVDVDLDKKFSEGKEIQKEIGEVKEKIDEVIEPIKRN